MCQDAQTDQHLDLGAVLTTRASALSHLMLVLFRKNGTAFLPGQNFSNTQLMCRAKMHAV